MQPQHVQQKSPAGTRLAAASAASALVLGIGVPVVFAVGAPAAVTQDAGSAVGGERLGLQAVQVAPLAGAPALPSGLSGRSWLVADAGTGEVLAARDAHLRLPPASTLKMLFADTVLPKLDRSIEHQVTPDELADVGVGSSLVGVKENLPYRVEDLWRGVFLSSGNDAVHVLAHMNGGVQQTVAEMQARARSLQANDTKVVSPDGYDMPGQVSSAYDLTLFARAGLRNADFRSYCSTRTARFPGGLDKTTGQRISFDIANTDRLLGKYPGLIGVKNGYTTNAGATFTGAAERNGRTLLVTVMHPEAQGRVYDEAASLLDWGFAAAGRVQPVGQLVEDLGGSETASPDAASEAADATQLPPWSRPPVLHNSGAGFAPALWSAGILGTALAVWGTARAAVRRRTAATSAPAPDATSAPAPDAPDVSSYGVSGHSPRRLARRARTLLHGDRHRRTR
ncbi:D-alanyl-D-alanine carboxypeptidase family protein [Kitasatospora sp. NPDC018058]|uniref:D-alanyl-D-alanine carboxypeptidase family protein n=1 Tax=Kitasatospora sp. NPDC018058 TaxID=3364025 RepID=UPI0037C0C593